MTYVRTHRFISRYLLLSALFLPALGHSQPAPTPLERPTPNGPPGDSVVVVAPPGISPSAPDTRCPIPRAAHVKPANTLYRPGFYRDRVVVKLRDDLGAALPTMPSNSFTVPRLARADGPALQSLNTLLRSVNPLGIRPAFSVTNTTLRKWRTKGQARSCQGLADLTQYFWLYLPTGSKGEDVADALNKSPLVEIAFLPPIPRDADEAPVTADMEANQGYLRRASRQGLDAKYAHDLPGGGGKGMKVIDIEATWNVNHEDLPKPFFFSGTILANEITSALPDTDANSHHGTAVIGEMVAKDDGHGVTGIAPDAQWGASSVVRAQALWGAFGWLSGIHDASVSDATARALEALSAGDVILIEQHSQGPAGNTACPGNCKQFEFVPMEYFPDSFDIFKTASANGVIVVQAAGNGTMNLDLQIYEGRFDRNQRDSGAIMVGGSLSTSRDPNGSSNSGSRVDVHAWGANVTTTGYGDVPANGSDVNQFYTDVFNGTSSASPMVAGAVLSIQGVLKASGQGVLTPRQMRDLLVRTGTAQATPITRPIGPMPNLRAALSEFDSVTAPAGGDGGTPFTIRCREGQSMVGIRGRAGGWIDQLQPICESAAGETTPVASAGGSLGAPFIRRCPAGLFVVGLRGRAGAVVDSLRVECANPNDARANRPITTLDAVGGTGGAVFGSNRCRRDRNAVGLRGRAGAFIDQVQLLCSTEPPAPTVTSPWVSQPVGGRGGDAAVITCDANQAMVGISVRKGAWIDRLSVRCAPVNATGQWTGDDSRGDGAGGTGGTPDQLVCPRNQAVSGISGKAGAFIERIRIRCKPLASLTATTGEEEFLGGVGGNGGNEFGRITCPGNLPASGFAVRTGAFVDQIKLRCGN